MKPIVETFVINEKTQGNTILKISGFWYNHDCAVPDLWRIPATADDSIHEELLGVIVLRGTEDVDRINPFLSHTTSFVNSMVQLPYSVRMNEGLRKRIIKAFRRYSTYQTVCRLSSEEEILSFGHRDWVEAIHSVERPYTAILGIQPM